MSLKREIKIEDALLIGGLIGVQFVYAGNSVLSSYIMDLGIDPLTLVIASTFATFLILGPFAICIERDRWPKKFSLKLILQMFLISFAGVTLFQSLFFEGIKLTSPAMATAMPNLAPGLIFIIAWTFGLERVDVKCIYSKIKILGTLLCVVGALTMSLLQSLASNDGRVVNSKPSDITFDKEKAIGCFYLIGAVFILSSNVVLQAITLGHFPAPISLCAITSFIGIFITAAVKLFDHPKSKILWSPAAFNGLVGYSILGGTVGGACVSFNGWAMKKRGPVLVSMFCPIGTVCSVILSALTLGKSIKLGSFAGMVLMFIGLYFVLWAKEKESHHRNNDSEKPQCEQLPESW